MAFDKISVGSSDFSHVRELDESEIDSVSGGGVIVVIAAVVAVVVIIWVAGYAVGYHTNRDR